jgi:hypothetical protein
MATEAWPNALLDQLRVDAGPHGERRPGVAEVVESDARQAGGLGSRLSYRDAIVHRCQRPGDLQTRPHRAEGRSASNPAPRRRASPPSPGTARAERSPVERVDELPHLGGAPGPHRRDRHAFGSGANARRPGLDGQVARSGCVPEHSVQDRVDVVDRPQRQLATVTDHRQAARCRAGPGPPSSPGPFRAAGRTCCKPLRQSYSSCSSSGQLLERVDRLVERGSVP